MAGHSLKRSVRGWLVLLSVICWVAGFACGLLMMYGREAAERHNTEVAMDKIAWHFAAKATAEGDADAVRHLHALSRQVMIPRLARAAERELATLRDRAASDPSALAAAVAEALNDVATTDAARREE